MLMMFYLENEMKNHTVYFLCLLIINAISFSVQAEPGNKVLITAEIKSHMLIYFPLPNPRPITLRIVSGNFKNCDISGLIIDSIDYKALYSRLGNRNIQPTTRDISYDLNITSRACSGVETIVHGHGHLMFSAVPNRDRSPRYQTIKRKHKVIILFESQSLAER